MCCRRLGVLVEVNCETDFVARGDKFKELVSDLAMQVGLQHQAVCGRPLPSLLSSRCGSEELTDAAAVKSTL